MKTSSCMTVINIAKNVGQSMFTVNYGEGSVAKSSHKGDINLIGLLGKRREHCEYVPTLQSMQYPALGL